MKTTFIRHSSHHEAMDICQVHREESVELGCNFGYGSKIINEIRRVMYNAVRKMGKELFSNTFTTRWNILHSTTSFCISNI